MDMAYRRDLIFDVGLHKGEDTEFYLKKGFEVVVFEANPDLVDHCKRHFHDSISCRRLHVIEGAIAPATAGERIVFHKNLQKSEWGTIDARWVERNQRLGSPSIDVEVERTDFAAVFRQYGIPFYLKIDIEGADHVVLDELQRCDDRPRYISIEAEKVDFAQLTADLDALRRLGYTAFKAVQQASIPGMTIATTALDGTPVRHVFADGASGPFGEDLSGPWLTYGECLRQFERIFKLYRLLGDDGVVYNLPGGTHFVRGLARLVRKPLPGWYDMHARLP
jgi:FkbM family methyltransferase